MRPPPVEIDRESLRRRLEDGSELVLVDALAPLSYAARHLPGAINITPARVDELAGSQIPDLDTEIVVYCADAGCDASVEVAQRLIELGYRNVRHYSGGKRDWADAGLPFEGGRI
ncbi:MAG TPA: rhodanese-like domain-containing protein [Gaiellaceae bacterium]|jgi:rhodanese-related sulfurtransferase|nr:rhodanese-like domain-containing protein [Gaiellaceae bacterium]